jgi:hypothetical protein
MRDSFILFLQRGVCLRHPVELRGFCCDVVAVDILGLLCQSLLNAASIVQCFLVFFCFVGLHFAHLERRILSLFEVLKRDRDRIKRFSFSRIV